MDNINDLYDRMYDLCGDPWTDDQEEIAKDREVFRNAILTGDKDMLKTYTDFITENRQYACEPYPTDKSKVWDFDLMRQYDSLVNEIRDLSDKAIRRDSGRWVFGKYIIEGGNDKGFKVNETVYESMDFEECLQWCVDRRY